jgi:hypothetical protein
LRALGLLGLLAVLLVLLAAAPSAPVLAMLTLLVGLSVPLAGDLNEAIQTLVPAGRRPEAFSWVYSLIAIGSSISNAVCGSAIRKRIRAQVSCSPLQRPGLARESEHSPF